MNAVADAAQRAEALDVRRSFRVTAPAGSGKTELLIQRFLALLPTVERPEQVLAITFSRKAAAEMLERVVAALGDAEAGNAVESPHQQRTRELATAALQHGRQRGWELARDIARFNIRTIDGFCSSLARQMPVVSGFGGSANAQDDAAPLYREAVADLFSMAGNQRLEAQDLDALLLHFDNNWEQLAELLSAMLGKREQWMDYVEAGRGAAGAEERLIATVEALVGEELREVHAALAPWLPRLYPLFRYAQSNLGVDAPECLPARSAENLDHWRGLGRVLLTGSGTLRKKVDKRDGFPAGSAEEKRLKAELMALLEEIRQDAPELPRQLRRLFWLPSMDKHSESWQLVVHLARVLPLLYACLLLVFTRRGAVDHTQVAVAAIESLGDDDAPTDLALRLDYQIAHILVDEFQDTANLQYRLIERLTRGWSQHNQAQPEAPRTLLIVGDGMQSIYGFRNANVGLFHEAGERGFSGLVPEPLALACNFRSRKQIVDWVNNTFADVFPAEGDLRRGTVAFSEASAVKGAAELEAAVEMQAFHGEDGARQEARWLAAEIAARLEDTALESIAVLGRTRGHLAPLVSELRRRNIPFAAQDMDPLGKSPVVIDLMTLCRALANPGDRLAWLALVRAPWCGLPLADLHVLADVDSVGQRASVAALIFSGAAPSGLSAEGSQRFARLSRCIRWAWQKRDQLALRVWVEQCWDYLGGPATAPEPEQIHDALHFFALLEKAEQDEVGLDPIWLQERVDKLYAPGGSPEAKLQVMTLHRAKGLEFDWVIMPALARGQRSDRRQILLWDEFNGRDGSHGFLLAANDHSDGKTEPGLYHYLQETWKEKARHETARLLYVGTTRAVQRLTLSATLKPVDAEDEAPTAFKDPAEGTLLAPIWPRFRRDMTAHPSQAVAQPPATGRPLQILRNPPAAPELPGASAPNVPDAARNRLERHVGSVAHAMLEQLAAVSPLPEEMPATLRDHGRYLLAQLGLAGTLLAEASAMVTENVNNTLGDGGHGRWLLDSEHRDASCELALTWWNDDETRDIVIDRTFIDRESGERWVIDYKSSAPGGDMSLEAFLAEETARYLEQLTGYRDCLAVLGDEPLRCALYFTRLGLLHRLVELDT